MQFDVGLINRVAQEIERSGQRMQKLVNSPEELDFELKKVESSIESLNSLRYVSSTAGANASTVQKTEQENQLGES